METLYEICFQKTVNIETIEHWTSISSNSSMLLQIHIAVFSKNDWIKPKFF